MTGKLKTKTNVGQFNLIAALKPAQPTTQVRGFMKQRRGLSGKHRAGDTISDGRWLKAGAEEHGLWRGEWTAGDTKDDKS